ncbi:class I SAM-dependent methyltransferase [Bradyrhizobium sp. WSM 1744]|uniref:Class I SAM-dependent methyltransferase n=2 Tax=Bradyrhizobium archetypum TaxID=2721160 RepID=A0A7Y4M392_9BRAD|nr:class I SAM-dependent methyltransferase [Bradyrhizobium archetypum]
MVLAPTGSVQADELTKAAEICPSCGCDEGVSLPIPAAGRSMLSDGRIIARAIDKIWCPVCGLVRHRYPPAAAEISAIYSGAYGLPALTGAGEQARGRAYAAAIVDAIGARQTGLRMIDVGCGSGAMLHALSECEGGASFQLIGIDPALPRALTQAGERVTLMRGFPDRELAGHRPFDVVVSINTIEHTPDPAQFLATLETLMAPDGQVVVICPTTEFANDELLFFDHFWSISPAAMISFAARSGLQLISHKGLAAPLAGFQLFRFARSAFAGSEVAVIDVSPDAIAYLNAWKELDASLEQQLVAANMPVQAFGAGQMAALLRAYAPRTFAMFERFLLDHPEEAWPLGPAVRYDGFDTLVGWATVVAVHPSSQLAVAARIRSDGGFAVTLPAAIKN